MSSDWFMVFCIYLATLLTLCLVLIPAGALIYAYSSRLRQRREMHRWRHAHRRPPITMPDELLVTQMRGVWPQGR